MKVMVTGGGTGGHIYPALAIASALQTLDPAIQLLHGGRAGGLEERVARQAGLEFHGLPGSPLSSTAGAVRAAGSLLRGLVQARRLLACQRVDVVVGTGGFASTALALAQVTRRGPLVLVEGNALPGRTNRLLARWAKVVCTAFEYSSSHLPEGKAVLTGFPVRESLLARRDRAQARAALGLEPDKFTLLVVGGSQGARFFNDLIAECAPALLEQNIQILHQLGAKNTDLQAPDLPGWVRMGYIEDMPSAYAAADAVLARAGASTFSEMALQGAASILTPYPFSQGGHQMVNARELAREGCVLVAPQDELTPGILTEIVLRLRDHPDERERLAANLKRWSRPMAARRVAEIALAAASGKPSVPELCQSSKGEAS